MNIKLNRINSIFQKEISYILATEIKDKNINFVTITAVEVTNDLSIAKIYVTVLNDENKEETLKSLKNASGFIRNKLFERVDLRKLPELKFVYDESLAYGSKIENLIDDLNKNN